MILFFGKTINSEYLNLDPTCSILATKDKSQSILVRNYVGLQSTQSSCASPKYTPKGWQ